MCFVEESDQFELFVCFVGLLGRFQSLFVDHCQLGLRKNTIQLVTALSKEKYELTSGVTEFSLKFRMLA